MVRRRIPIKAEVRPLPHLPSSRLGESSGSGQLDDTAFATTRLYETLSEEVEDDGPTKGSVYVSVAWPEERRLAGKGKAKNLIVLVKPLPEGLRTTDQEDVLYTPLQLIPRYSNAPLRATLHPHQPVELSLVILQSISSPDIPSDVDVLEVQPLLSDHKPPMNGSLPNGHANGHLERPSSKELTILREGHSTSLTRKDSHTRTPLRILMSEPVAQGYATRSTRFILSDTPWDPDGDEDDSYMDSMADGASSHGRTTLSLADFDPDAFLSSSLALALQPSYGEDTDVDADMAVSVSSTSGSITPRPPGTVVIPPPSPPARLKEMDNLDGMDENEVGTRFGAVRAMGPDSNRRNDDVCWVSVGGLGRAGIFEGDWVTLMPSSGTSSSGRLARLLAWERLDEDIDDLPANPIIVPPDLYRALFPLPNNQPEIILQPTTFGARLPTIPTARSVSICRLASSESVDRRYERAWLKGVKDYFTSDLHTDDGGTDTRTSKLVKRGDIFSVPVWQDRLLGSESVDDDGSEDDSEDEADDDESTTGPAINRATGLVYFKVTAINYDPLVSLEDDFRSSSSSKARAGELGCWIDVGEDGHTQMTLDTVERERISGRAGDRTWHQTALVPKPYSHSAATKLRNLLSSCFASQTASRSLQLSILVKGARGSGKRSLVRSLADEIGYNVISVECFDVVGESQAVTEGSILAQFEKAKSAAPSILLLHHIEALAKKAESAATGKVPPIVKFLDDLLGDMRTASLESGWPIVLMGTTIDEDSAPGDLLSCFKQDIQLSAPNEAERLLIVGEVFQNLDLAPDVDLRSIATQTAALQPADIGSLALRAKGLSLRRASTLSSLADSTFQIGVRITSADIAAALTDARSSYSDSIGAPKIPNVSWDDIGGLQNVKDDILDTIQLPLQHPELFAQGLKKRSGILLYGPPGTGKTLLAKAVATSCSLNFFSVKGPELLNMYIGESEANVRRVFQRARDASPCVVFMDELDSIAPKRGNQGDSGGVVDRIVSQLLAELDGMSSGGDNTQVYVLGATNRPDLLDPALLRPGRFDRMLYLSVATTDSEQLSILQALTRKFNLDSDLDLDEISKMCPFNYTGADFYALCSDAMLKAMTRAADKVDTKVESLNREPGDLQFPKPLTVQYYLASLATKDDVEVKVGRADFVAALKGMKPSVSESEMKHYERVQHEFKGYNIGESK